MSRVSLRRGDVGGTLIRKLRASGQEVRIANLRRPVSLRDFAAETAATAVTVAEVAARVDVLIVSTPFQNHSDGIGFEESADVASRAWPPRGR